MGDSDFVGRLFGQPGRMRPQRPGAGFDHGPGVVGDFGPGGNIFDPTSTQFASGNLGLWTPAYGGGQVYHPFNLLPANQMNPDVTGWFRQSPPQLFWPNREINQFPVWPTGGLPTPPPSGGIDIGTPPLPPPGGPPPGGTAPPSPGGMVPNGSAPPGINMSYPPGAFGPQYGPSTGAGGDTGGPPGSPEGSPSGSGGGFGLGGFSISPSFSNTGLSFGGAVGQGLQALGLGPVAGQLGNAIASIVGGPFAGLANMALGGIIGGVNTARAASNLALLSALARAPRSSVGDVDTDPTTNVNMGLVDEGIGMTSGQPGISGPQSDVDMGMVDAGIGMTSEGGVDSSAPGSGGGEGGGGTGSSGSSGDTGVGEYYKGGIVRDVSRRKGGAEPITAHQGEFVMRPEATRKFAPILAWINNAPSQASPEQLMQLITMVRTMDQRRGRSI